MDREFLEAATEKFNNETLELESLEIPFTSTDSFIAFDVINDVGVSDQELFLKPAKAGFEKYEQLDKIGKFGVPRESRQASVISKLNDIIFQHAYKEDGVKLSEYKVYIEQVMAALNSAPVDFDSFAQANEKEINAELNEPTYKDDYDKYALKRSDF
jgi:hypothetical protein